MSASRYLAFDIGASNGRAFVGALVDGKLAKEEIYRFPNEPVEVSGTLYWDVLSIYGHLLKGMREYVKRYGPEVDGIGIDTWGVDFGLLTPEGQLLSNPVHYRDTRTTGMLEALNERIPLTEVFEQTGMNHNHIYSACQMLAMQLKGNSSLQIADTFLMMPDLLAYFLTGEKRCEVTNGITTLLYDPRNDRWNKDFISRLELPDNIWPQLIKPGTEVGELSDDVKRQTGLRRAKVIAPCTHDTPSAVAAIPGEGNDWAFISCGTWSIVGALTEELVTTSKVLEFEMANEITLNGRFLCKNISGLFLLQQSREIWMNNGDASSYAELVELARQVPAGPVIDPMHADFLAPRNMIDAIRGFCQRTGQRPPEGVAETTRCIIDSLALCYRQYIDRLQQVLGRRFNKIHFVGGGSNNTLICQLTADLLGIPVIAGPVETTVAGNILTQAYAMGEIKSAEEVRQVVRRSSTLTEYSPSASGRGDELYALFCDTQNK